MWYYVCVSQCLLIQPIKVTQYISTGWLKQFEKIGNSVIISLVWNQFNISLSIIIFNPKLIEKAVLNKITNFLFLNNSLNVVFNNH